MLNDNQQQIVNAVEGAVLVTAGAGSGKTRILTNRIAHIVLDLNVPEYNILAITFTNKATNEMRERLDKMLAHASDIWVSTFHAMCLRILKSGITHIGYDKNFTLYGEAEKKRIIESYVKANNLDEELVKLSMHCISDAKNKGFDCESYAAVNEHHKQIAEVTKIFKAYQAELTRNNALDLDDILNKALELLLNHAETRQYYANKFKFIHVDEFQDTNQVQYQIVKILASVHGNIFCVGDEDQSIYGWRGANVNNIFSFKRDFNAQVFKLEQNYRSTKKIIELANKVIKNNTTRLDKVLFTDNDDGEKIEYYNAQSESDEANFVLNNILNLVKYKNYKYNDFAVLMRLNAFTRPFEEKFLSYNIPHHVFGGLKFFERKEIKDLLAYLKALHNPRDEESLRRIINFPKRGIGDSALTQLINYSAFYNSTLYCTVLNITKNTELPKTLITKVQPLAHIYTELEKVKEQPIDIIVKKLLSLLNFKQVYNTDSEEDLNRLANIDEFVSMTNQRVKDGLVTLEQFLDSVSLYTDLDELDEKNNSISLATIHASKGLEFRCVFVVGCEENNFPLSRAMQIPSELEEERRLMYVAITRAKQRLFISSSKSRFMYGQHKQLMPSRFLSEAGLVVKRVLTPEKPPEPRQTFTPKYVAASNNTQVKTRDLSGFSIGATVKHPRFGIGKIQNLSGSPDNLYAEILFDGAGVLNLALAFAPLELCDNQG